MQGRKKWYWSILEDTVAVLAIPTHYDRIQRQQQASSPPAVRLLLSSTKPRYIVLSTKGKQLFWGKHGQTL